MKEGKRKGMRGGGSEERGIVLRGVFERTSAVAAAAEPLTQRLALAVNQTRPRCQFSIPIFGLFGSVRLLIVPTITVILDDNRVSLAKVLKCRLSLTAITSTVSLSES